MNPSPTKNRIIWPSEVTVDMTVRPVVRESDPMPSSMTIVLVNTLTNSYGQTVYIWIYRTVSGGVFEYRTTNDQAVEVVAEVSKPIATVVVTEDAYGVTAQRTEADAR